MSLTKNFVSRARKGLAVTTVLLGATFASSTAQTQSSSDPVIQHPHGPVMSVAPYKGQRRMDIDCGEFTRHMPYGIWFSHKLGQMADPNNEKIGNFSSTSAANLASKSLAERQNLLSNAQAEYLAHLPQHGSCVYQYNKFINSNLNNIKREYRHKADPKYKDDCLLVQVRNMCLAAGLQVTSKEQYLQSLQQARAPQ